ncbi:MAG: hypothetical protein QOG80_2108 [Pseudonocardiales bacterium]|jgi:hypothetical protein|nr:hypothetical protein [Pseudonocardiales bacterium]
MLIDCDTCTVRGSACHDCVVTVFLDISARPVEIDAAEREALDSLAAAGLVPPLRLVRGLAVEGQERTEGIA